MSRGVSLRSENIPPMMSVKNAFTSNQPCAWAEFYWHFTATRKKDGAPVATDGREKQIYRKTGGRWVLVHAHYSALPASR